MFTYKERVVSCFLNVFIAVLGVFFTWFGVVSVDKYLSYPVRIYYSTFCVSLVFSILVLGPLFISGFPIIFKGKRFGQQTASLLYKSIIVGVFFAVCAGLLFRLYYLNEINSRGYTECPKIAIGVFNGVSTQYVVKPEYCLR